MSRTKQWGRNPYARTDYYRQTVPKVDREPCKWCGNREGKYQYKVDGDHSLNPSRAAPWSRGFCSVSCYRAAVEY